MSDASLQRAMDNAEASINMEGLYVSELCKEFCEKLINEEITFDEYLKWVISEVDNSGV